MAADVGDLIIKFSKQEYKICGLSGSDTVLDLKNAIYKQTGVLPQHQKLAGFKVKVGQNNDDSQLSSMMLKPNMKLTLIGSRADVIAGVRKPPRDLPEVINDFVTEDNAVAIQHREEYLAIVKKRVKDYKVTQLHPFRDNKKLLVLDIDYTLFDHISTPFESPNELIRPYLHEFLQKVYADYDIAIWSATSMEWIEAKLKMLGVSSNPDYKICCYLDADAMIYIYTPKHGVMQVKPLGVIWGKFRQWNRKNTIMVDDVRWNFIMNPKNGLCVQAYCDAHVRQTSDKELQKLSEYLQDIADVDDLSKLNHCKWEHYKRLIPRKATAPSQASAEGPGHSEGQGQGGVGTD